MTLPSATALFGALDATWPAISARNHAGWIIRDGAGGGRRVCAALPTQDATDPEPAEAAMHALGQPLVFRLVPEDAALDTVLAKRGYDLSDPTLVGAVEINTIARDAPPVTLFPHWPPLAITRDIWSEAGIGMARQRAMTRSREPHTAFLARTDDRVAGAAYCAIFNQIAVLHALEVTPSFRRRGIAEMMLRGSAYWAGQQGAQWMAVAFTEANLAAGALLDKLGFRVMARYHYRQKEEPRHVHPSDET